MTLRHFIFHHFWLKLLSVALGTIIWLAIHHSIDQDYNLSEPAASRRVVRETLTVPISPVMLEDDNRTFKLTPSNAVITVIAPGTALHGYERGDIKVFVDLTGFNSIGPAQVDLLPGVPHDMNVLDIKPHSITVEPISH